MLLGFLFALIGFICIAQAFVVPPNTGDGVYGIHIDERDDYTPGVHCACGFNLNSSNVEAANQQMINKLNQGTPDNTKVIVIVDNVIAFVCPKGYDFSVAPYKPNTKDWNGYVGQVSKACGNAVAGTFASKDGGNGYSNPGLAGQSPWVYFGYMRYSSGLEQSVCVSPASAAAQSCSQTKRSEDQALPTRSTANATKVLDTRQPAPTIPDKVHCGCGYNMDSTNYANARIQMDKRLGDSAFLESSTSAWVGDVIVFACRQDNSPRLPVYDPASFNILLNRIGDACGQYVAGTYSVYRGEYTYNYGAMIYTSGLENSVCDSPDSSSATSC